MYGLRLRELRENKGIAQHELAQYLKVSREAYSHYESGRRQMNYDILFLLADYYNITIDFLLGRCEVNPMVINIGEAYLIERYRLLDDRGKSGVEATLNFEFEQSYGKPDKKAAM
jgi:transcriptional regulator with XRE-family HTH domain